MLSIDMDDAEIKRALAAIGNLPLMLEVNLRDYIDGFMLSVQADAQEKAPVDSGTLSRSARTSTRLIGDAIGSEITFGGLAAAYAEVQHERDDYEHLKGGQAHWLYGADDSAWTDGTQRELMVTMGWKAQELAEDHLKAQGGAN